MFYFFFFQAEDGIRDRTVTGVQTCALPIFTLVSQACGIFAAGLIGAAVLVVCHMVFVRYALNHNTIWQTDFTIYSLIGATFIGSPYVLLTRGHVNVDVLP